MYCAPCSAWLPGTQRIWLSSADRCRAGLPRSPGGFAKSHSSATLDVLFPRPHVDVGMKGCGIVGLARG